MKLLNIFRITIFISILVIPVLNMNLEPNQVSEIDNRKLTEASEILSGDVTTNVENYIDDRIGFRTNMINIYTRAMDSIFNNMVHPSYEYGEEGYVFPKLSREVLYKDFQESFSEFISRIQNYCQDRNIDFLYVVEPSKSTVYSDFLPKGVNYQNLNVNYLVSLLDEKGVNYLKTADVLIEAKDKYQVFDKKYDANHWNETGALIGISTILNELNKLDSTVTPFDINNYEVGTKVNTTLPVSYFPISEETYTYTLQSSEIKNIDIFKDKIMLSEKYRNFSHYINESNPTAPRILVFAGSYFNGKDKFLTPSFSEYILVHNYFNVMNYDYYINLFNPDIVLFESTEYTHNSNFFYISYMDSALYNKSLANYTGLPNTEYTTVKASIEYQDNGAITEVKIPLSNNNTLYSYIKIGDRILDCRTIEKDSIQYAEFSIATSELSTFNEFTLITVSKNESECSEIRVPIKQ